MNRYKPNGNGFELHPEGPWVKYEDAAHGQRSVPMENKDVAAVQCKHSWLGPHSEVDGCRMCGLTRDKVIALLLLERERLASGWDAYAEKCDDLQRRLAEAEQARRVAVNDFLAERHLRKTAEQATREAESDNAALRSLIDHILNIDAHDRHFLSHRERERLQDIADMPHPGDTLRERVKELGCREQEIIYITAILDSDEHEVPKGYSLAVDGVATLRAEVERCRENR